MAGEVTNENEFVAVPFQAEISWDIRYQGKKVILPRVLAH